MTVLAVVLLAGCGLLPSDGGLDGTWRLVSGTLRGQAITPLEAAPITLTIAGGEVSGSAGCNSYGGPVAINGDRLTFGELATTLIGCGPEAGVESAYLEALRGSDRARRDGPRLTLTGPRSELAFEVLEPTPDAALIGPTWRLETVVAGDVAMTTDGADAIHASFAGGSVTLTVGCRVLTGTYALDGGRIEVAGMEVGELACPDALPPATEDRIVEALVSGFSASIAGDRLQVTSAGGLGLEFRAAS